jgi:hypothetical protein
MKLHAVRVWNFRSIVDSDLVEIDPRLTVLVGKNEQGKTTFLKAMTSFESGSAYSASDLPNHLRAALEDQAPADIPIVTLLVIPDESDKNRLAEMLPELAAVEQFIVTRFYDGHYTYRSKLIDGSEHDFLFPTAAISPQVEKIKAVAESLKVLLAAHAARVPTFMPAKGQADSHIDQLLSARFGEIATLENVFSTFFTALKSLPGQDAAIQNDITTSTAAIQKLSAEMRAAPQLSPEAFFRSLMPQFVLHSTAIDRIPDEVGVADFLKDPAATSKGMLNLCQAAGLSQQKIQELSMATDTGRLHAHEDDYRSSISGGINEFWTQETYEVHFGIQKEKISVSITDAKYGRRISPSGRSDGFQWYLSFYCSLMSQVSGTSTNIVLLDNPALELHPDGQRDIRRFLAEKLPAASQIIYVTHSPAMIDPFNLEQVRNVVFMPGQRSTKISRLRLVGGKALDLLEPVRSAVGASLVSTLMSNDFNVLVEGAADKPILEGAFERFDPANKDRVVINGSISETGSLLPQFYQRAGLPFVVYLDADSGGRDLKKSLLAFGIPEEKILLLSDMVKRSDGKDFELEDLVSADLYQEAVQKAYPGQADIKVDASALKRTKLYEEAFKKNYGIGFSKRRASDELKQLLRALPAEDSPDSGLRVVVAKLSECLRGQVATTAAPTLPAA